MSSEAHQGMTAAPRRSSPVDAGHRPPPSRRRLAVALHNLNSCSSAAALRKSVAHRSETAVLVSTAPRVVGQAHLGVRHPGKERREG
eukprot:CAMPEP_0174708484 /NCGR_PEP_ID=MMETSP1094-20130205/10728_1 /TAXON_ID=156173 /ORGANISM="Chrysochromulina brevifilum, Strain UTEX LB 985" /LENGTH=86 /DNA_ID=CAMNT_0015907055 /DNA_START=772 /DNA_END=1029 /DNA_ORIENTATION=-